MSPAVFTVSFDKVLRLCILRPYSNAACKMSRELTIPSSGRPLLVLRCGPGAVAAVEQVQPLPGNCLPRTRPSNSNHNKTCDSRTQQQLAGMAEAGGTW